MTDGYPLLDISYCARVGYVLNMSLVPTSFQTGQIYGFGCITSTSENYQFYTAVKFTGMTLSWYSYGRYYNENTGSQTIQNTSTGQFNGSNYTYHWLAIG